MGIDDRHLPVRFACYLPSPGGPLRALFAFGVRMRGFHDEMGGPESIASAAEWGELGWGDGVTAAGLPASPGAPSAFESPSENPYPPGSGLARLRDVSDDTLRHNFLLRRHLNDPGYGASREVSWREKCANGLGVASVPSRGIHGQILSSPSG